jgi:ABC-2 type transport system permease protein
MTLHGVYTVFRKELADHFSSYRFIILFALISMVSIITVYMAGVGLREGLQGVAKPKFVFLMLFTSTGAIFSLSKFVAFFGPLIGLILGFDSINRERAGGTLSKIVSQPIYRDSIINGKFLAGVTTIAIMLTSIMLIVSGLGLRLLGVVPGIEEVMRLFIYLIISLFYISFWLGIAILFSVLFRSVATSALASIAMWIFFSFFVSLGATVIANAVAPIETQEGANIDKIVKNVRIQRAISLFSPMSIYTDSTATIIDPMRKTTQSLILMGPIEKFSSQRFQNPLPILQSIFVVFPYLTILIAITLICFAITYSTFMLQEIRSV